MEWIKTGWGPNLQQEFSSILPYVLDCSEVKISDKNFFDIATMAIEKIVKKFPEPFYLMSTGGVDSQAMIYCWLKSGYPFKIKSYKFNEIYNIHDLENLIKFTDIHGINFTFDNFNLIDFLDNELLNYAKQYYCTSPQMCAFMKICDDLNHGTIIFSGNLLTLIDSGLNYTLLGMKRYAEAKKNVIPFFFQHDQELAGSLLPFYKYILQKENKKDNYTAKIKGYEYVGIKVIPQVHKFSGFEKIKDLYDNRDDLVSIKDKVEFSSKPSKRYFDIHYRYKLERIIKYVDPVIYILPKTYYRQI